MLKTTFRRIASAVGVLLVLAVVLGLLLLEGKENYNKGVELTRQQYQGELEKADSALPPHSLAEGDAAYHRTIEKLKHVTPPPAYTKVNNDLIHYLEVEAGYWHELAHANSRSVFDNTKRKFEQTRLAFTKTFFTEVHKAEND